MGRIANRTNEFLGSSDLSIVKFRQQMLKAAKEFVAGAPAIGTGKKINYVNLSSFEGIVPKTTDWRTLRDKY